MCYQIVLDEDNNGDVIVLEVFFTPPWFAEVDNKMHQLVPDSDITRINPGIFCFEVQSPVTSKTCDGLVKKKPAPSGNIYVRLQGHSKGDEYE